jgi:hypothetical protein
VRDFNSIFVNVDDVVENMVKVEDKEGRLDYFATRQRGASDISDLTTYMALSMNLHVFWETTGYSIQWTVGFTSLVRRNSAYKIVLYYPYVRLSELLKRARMREQAYSEETLIKNYPNSQKNLKELLFYVDSLIIFDNDDVKSQDRLIEIISIEHNYPVPRLSIPEKDEQNVPAVPSRGDFFKIKKGPNYEKWFERWNEHGLDEMPIFAKIFEDLMRSNGFKWEFAEKE